MDATGAMIERMEVYQAIGENVSSYSTPSTCENPLATNLALYFLMLPSTACLIL
jgi:hypothetical protein